MTPVRHLVAILLLTVLGLPLLPSALALGQEGGAGLPACCRRAGAHHCAMTMGEKAIASSVAQGPEWKAPLERCPYCPATVVATQHGTWLVVPARAVSLPVSDSDPLRVRQAECSWRIARDGARHKRGPPVISPA